MKTQKKIVSLILILIIGALCVSIYTASTFRNAAAGSYAAEIETETATEEVSEYTDSSAKLYDKAMSRFTKTASVNEENVTTYSNDFGGVFIDDDGILNIGVVSDNSRLKSLQTISNFDGQVRYKPYTYSYNYLNEIKDALLPIMENNNIYKIVIKESLNKVIVSLNYEKSVSEVISYLQKVNLYNEDAINFTVDPFDKVTTTSATTVYSGDELGYNFYDNIDKTGTIGASVRCNKTGAYGIITNGHVAPEGKTMINKYRQILGVRDRGQTSGTIDAAFVPFANPNAWETTPHARYGSEYFNNIRLGSESHIVEGQAVKRIGSETGVTTGNITSRNVSTTIRVDGANKTITNTFEYDNAPEEGDSGGPVYFNDGANLFLLGLNFAKTGQRGYACRISEIMKILDVSPITNDPLPLGMEVVARYGAVTPSWDIRLNNRNNFEVYAEYNGRMCFEDDARYFRNLNNEQGMVIPANGSVVVHIDSNGTAGWITANISFSASDGSYGRMVSYTNGLSSPGYIVPWVNPIAGLPLFNSSSVPDYLGMEVSARYGWLWYDWDIKLSNPNSSAVTVTYNQRMCFEGDARNFTNLSEQINISIPANSSAVVRINSNGTAGYITSAISYTVLENAVINNIVYKVPKNYKRISYANGLGINPNKLTRYTNQISA